MEPSKDTLVQRLLAQRRQQAAAANDLEAYAAASATLKTALAAAASSGPQRASSPGGSESLQRNSRVQQLLEQRRQQAAAFSAAQTGLQPFLHEPFASTNSHVRQASELRRDMTLQQQHQHQQHSSGPQQPQWLHGSINPSASLQDSQHQHQRQQQQQQQAHDDVLQQQQQQQHPDASSPGSSLSFEFDPPHSARRSAGRRSNDSVAGRASAAGRGSRFQQQQPRAPPHEEVQESHSPASSSSPPPWDASVRSSLQESPPRPRSAMPHDNSAGRHTPAGHILTAGRRTPAGQAPAISRSPAASSQGSPTRSSPSRQPPYLSTSSPAQSPDPSSRPRHTPAASHAARPSSAVRIAATLPEAWSGRDRQRDAPAADSSRTPGGGGSGRRGSATALLTAVGVGGGGGDGGGSSQLSDLERLLSLTLNPMSLDPRAPAGERAGPFDISELWANASQPSISEGGAHSSSLASSVHGGDQQSEDTAVSRHDQARDQRGGRQPFSHMSGPAHRARPAAPRRDAAQAGAAVAQQQQQQQQHATARRPVRATAVRSAAAASRPRSAAATAVTPARRQAGHSGDHRSPSAAAAAAGGTRGGVMSRLTQRPRSAAPAGGGMDEVSRQPHVDPKSRQMMSHKYPDREQRILQLSQPRHWQQQHKLDEIRRELEEEELRHCTFAPQMVAGRSHSTSRLLRRSSGGDNDDDDGDFSVHERLYLQRPAWEGRRDKLIAERDAALLAECTFKPLVNRSGGGTGGTVPPSPSRSSPTRAGGHAPHGRPTSAGGGTSRPASPAPTRTSHLRSSASHLQQLPIHERVADLLRSRSERLSDTRQQLERDQATFKPQLNARSLQLAAVKLAASNSSLGALLGPPAAGGVTPRGAGGTASAAGRRGAAATLPRGAAGGTATARTSQASGGGGGGSPSSLRTSMVMQPGERLYHEAVQRQQRGGTGDEAGQRPDELECTFAPAINERSRRMVQGADLPEGFLDRQRHLSAVAAEKKSLFRSLVEDEAGCTFQPQVLGAPANARLSWVSSAGGSSSDDVLLQLDDAADRIQKLAYQDKVRSQALRDALTEHYYGQFTFSPDLNLKSRRMGRRHSLTELYHNAEGKRAQQRAVAAAEQREASECTFQPALNPTSLEMLRQRGGRIMSSLDAAHLEQLRQARLQEARSRREYEELRECSFVPEINRRDQNARTNSTATVPVAGLDRFMELQALAKQRKVEEQKRRDEVWRAHPKGNPTLYTVPQPFKLSRPHASGTPRAQQRLEGPQAGQGEAGLKAKVTLRRSAEARRAEAIKQILWEAEQAGPTSAL